MENNRGLNSNCLLRFKDRISSSREIQEIFKYGTVIKCSYFNFYIKKSVRLRTTVIIRKFQKGTVDRNKIKRRIKEIFRTSKICFQYDTIIKVKKNLLKIKFDVLKKQIQDSLQNFNKGII
jgi:ribonuclease P protein component